jgi:hypothetical protein
VVANDDLDHSPVVAGFDVDGDRARLARMHDRIVERIACGDQDVQNLVLADVLLC